MEGSCVTVKLVGQPLYFGFVEGFETSGEVIPSEPGAPLGQSLISWPRSAARAMVARRTVRIIFNMDCLLGIV